MASPSAFAGGRDVLTVADNGSTKNVTVGAEVEVQLVSGSDGGYLWHVSGLDQSMVKLMGTATVPGSTSGGLTGAPATQKFSFATLAPGNTTLTLLEYRSWEGPGSAIATFSVNLQVN